MSDDEQEKYKKKAIPKRIKDITWNLWMGKEKGEAGCFVCTETINSKHFDCGHVISEKKKGKTTPTNLRPICSACNKSMGTKNMREFAREYGFSTHHFDKPASQNNA